MPLLLIPLQHLTAVCKIMFSFQHRWAVYVQEQEMEKQLKKLLLRTINCKSTEYVRFDGMRCDSQWDFRSAWGNLLRYIEVTEFLPLVRHLSQKLQSYIVQRGEDFFGKCQKLENSLIFIYLFIYLLQDKYRIFSFWYWSTGTPTLQHRFSRQCIVISIIVYICTDFAFNNTTNCTFKKSWLHFCLSRQQFNIHQIHLCHKNSVRYLYFCQLGGLFSHIMCDAWSKDDFNLVIMFEPQVPVVHQMSVRHR